MRGGAITDGTVEWELIKDSDMPSTVYETIAYTPSTSSSWVIEEYVPPADGYLSISVYAPSGVTNAMVQLHTSKDNISGRYRLDSVCVNNSARWFGTTIAVSGGSLCSIDTVEPLSVGRCSFIYSINSAKELGLI